MAARITVNGRTVVHKKSEGRSVTFCDVCMARRGDITIPVPYTSVGRSDDLSNATKTIVAQGETLAHEQSIFAQTLGGEAGDLNGVTSGTTTGQAEFLSFSLDVSFEGKGVVRDRDWMIHNNKNSEPAPLIQPSGEPDDDPW